MIFFRTKKEIAESIGVTPNYLTKVKREHQPLSLKIKKRLLVFYENKMKELVSAIVELKKEIE